MTKTDEFSSVFCFGRRYKGAFLHLLVRVDRRQAVGRIGVVLARSKARRAVDRNVIRRMVRRIFSAAAKCVPADFVVVLVRPYRSADFPVVQSEMDRLFRIAVGGG